MSKRERNMIIVLGVLLAPVAFVYLDIDFGGNSSQDLGQETLNHHMEEINLIMSMIPGGGKSPEYVNLSSWGRDIFDRVDNTDATSNVVTKEVQFFLSGIMISGLVRSAIINDEVVTEGQIIDRYFVESILDDMVVLSRNQKKIVLSLSE